MRAWLFFVFKVIRVDIEREPDLLDLDDLLIFSGFFLFFGFLKSVLAVVHDLADGRFGGGGDLDKVKILALRYLERLRGGHDAKLLAVVGNNSYLLITDLLIDLLFFAADVKAPPGNSIKKRGREEPEPRMKINACTRAHARRIKSY